jgi:hypothetical protein
LLHTPPSATPLPRGTPSQSALQRGLRAFFAEHYRDAGVLLAGLPVAACVVMLQTHSLDLWGVAAFVRRCAPGIPVALVVGPSRTGDSARASSGRRHSFRDEDAATADGSQLTSR